MSPAERAVLARYPDAECWRTMSYPKLEHPVLHYEVSRDDGVNLHSLGIGRTSDAAWADAAARLDIETADSHIPSVPGSPVPSARPLPERTAQ